jgi:hypothetical protein
MYFEAVGNCNNYQTELSVPIYVTLYMSVIRYMLQIQFQQLLITMFVSINIQTNELRRFMEYYAVYSRRVHRRLEETVASLKMETRTFPEDCLLVMAHFPLGVVSPRNLALKKCFNKSVQFVNMLAYQILLT